MILRPIIRGFGAISTNKQKLSFGSSDLTYRVEPIKSNRVICDLESNRVRAENKVCDELELSFKLI